MKATGIVRRIDEYLNSGADTPEKLENELIKTKKRLENYMK